MNAIFEDSQRVRKMNELEIRFLIMTDNANGIRSTLAALQWELYGNLQWDWSTQNGRIQI